MNCKFKEVVGIDHAFLDSVTLFHAMDDATWYSAGVVGTQGAWMLQFMHWNRAGLPSFGSQPQYKMKKHL